ncbi:hypothetical protein B0H13DRAFT_2275918 [Mycena leptocephala]|nr:hypothetical protein B0H13DRAFT_2275918 [Mycena leptocephala]
MTTHQASQSSSASTTGAAGAAAPVGGMRDAPLPVSTAVPVVPTPPAIPARGLLAQGQCGCGTWHRDHHTRNVRRRRRRELLVRRPADAPHLNVRERGCAAVVSAIRPLPIISDGNAAAPHGVTVMLPTLLSPQPPLALPNDQHHSVSAIRAQFKSSREIAHSAPLPLGAARIHCRIGALRKIGRRVHCTRELHGHRPPLSNSACVLIRVHTSLRHRSLHSSRVPLGAIEVVQHICPVVPNENGERREYKSAYIRKRTDDASSAFGAINMRSRTPMLLKLSYLQLRRLNSGGENRWIKLDPIKKIPELMGSPLPTAIKVGCNGPRPPAQ